MRNLAYLSLLFLAACGVDEPGTPPTPTSFDSVRDRLSHEPTRLFIPGTGSTGSLVAKRYTHDGWVEGTSTLAITAGALTMRAGGDQVTATAFELELAPIDLPDAVFGKPAQLTDVRVALATSVTAPATWSGDDDATATLPVKLDLEWSIAIDQGVTQLGTQHLPAIPLDLTLTGGGDHVDATLAIRGDGTLWTWADLLQLADLRLEIAAATVE
jgi:hypothetical protein